MSKLIKAIRNAVEDFHKAGIIDDATLRKFHEECVIKKKQVKKFKYIVNTNSNKKFCTLCCAPIKLGLGYLSARPEKAEICACSEACADKLKWKLAKQRTRSPDMIGRAKFQ